MDDWEDIARNEFIDELYSDFARDVLGGRDELYGVSASSGIMLAKIHTPRSK